MKISLVRLVLPMGTTCFKLLVPVKTTNRNYKDKLLILVASTGTRRLSGRDPEQKQPGQMRKMKDRMLTTHDITSLAGNACFVYSYTSHGDDP